MSRHRMFNEPVDRVVIKLPRPLAAFFRKNFKHGQRSTFVASCIEEFQQKHELKTMETELSEVRDTKHSV